MPLAERVLPNASDDIESTETVDSLYQRYVAPIDQLRSITKPSPYAQTDKTIGISSTFNNLEYSSNVLESRTHAFYRMLGFPVVSSDKRTFYNPGFDPNFNQNYLTRLAVASNQLEVVKTATTIREFNSIGFADIFKRQDLVASYFALLLRYPIPFQVLDESKSPFDQDNQFFPVPDRIIASDLFIAGSTSPDFVAVVENNQNTFSGTPHLLRPFVVDPNIEITVSPDVNRVCVPFLKSKNDTKITQSKFLQRPGLEFIIRERLAGQIGEKDFGKELVKNYLDFFNQDEDFQDLFESINDEKKDLVAEDLEKLFGSPDSKQIEVVTKLIKCLKLCIRRLAQSFIAIDTVKAKIGWVPIVSKKGPEAGIVGAALSPVGINDSRTQIDSRIAALKTKKALIERRINENKDLGFFASPFFGSVGGEDLEEYDRQISNETQKRDSFAKIGFEALGIVEKVTGQVSGLGLIDIISIYLALWTVDLETLINFLDNNSFQRLYDNNLEFRGAAEIESRFNGSTKDIESVLEKFEEKLISILKFCDKLLQEEISSPLNQSGGSV